MNGQQYQKLERNSHLLISGLIECSLRYAYCQKVENFFSNKELGRLNDPQKIHGLKYILEIDLIGFLVKLAFGNDRREVSLEKLFATILPDDSQKFVLTQFKKKMDKYIDILKDVGERQYRELFWKLGNESIEGVFTSLLTRWERFKANGRFTAFRLVRDKVFAHNEAFPLDVTGKTSPRLYSILDAFYMFSDIELMYTEMKEMVAILSFIVTSRYYDHSSMERQQSVYVDGFVM